MVDVQAPVPTPQAIPRVVADVLPDGTLRIVSRTPQRLEHRFYRYAGVYYPHDSPAVGQVRDGALIHPFSVLTTGHSRLPDDAAAMAAGTLAAAPNFQQAATNQSIPRRQSHGLAPAASNAQGPAVPHQHQGAHITSMQQPRQQQQQEGVRTERIPHTAANGTGIAQGHCRTASDPLPHQPLSQPLHQMLQQGQLANSVQRSIPRMQASLPPGVRPHDSAPERPLPHPQHHQPLPYGPIAAAATSAAAAASQVPHATQPPLGVSATGNSGAPLAPTPQVWLRHAAAQPSPHANASYVAASQPVLNTQPSSLHDRSGPAPTADPQTIRHLQSLLAAKQILPPSVWQELIPYIRPVPPLAAASSALSEATLSQLYPQQLLAQQLQQQQQFSVGRPPPHMQQQQQQQQQHPPFGNAPGTDANISSSASGARPRSSPQSLPHSAGAAAVPSATPGRRASAPRPLLPRTQHETAQLQQPMQPLARHPASTIQQQPVIPQHRMYTAPPVPQQSTNHGRHNASTLPPAQQQAQRQWQLHEMEQQAQQLLQQQMQREQMQEQQIHQQALQLLQQQAQRQQMLQQQMQQQAMQQQQVQLQPTHADARYSGMPPPSGIPVPITPQVAQGTGGGVSVVSSSGESTLAHPEVVLTAAPMQQQPPTEHRPGAAVGTADVETAAPLPTLTTTPPSSVPIGNPSLDPPLEEQQLLRQLQQAHEPPEQQRQLLLGQQKQLHPLWQQDRERLEANDQEGQECASALPPQHQPQLQQQAQPLTTSSANAGAGSTLHATCANVPLMASSQKRPLEAEMPATDTTADTAAPPAPAPSSSRLNHETALPNMHQPQQQPQLHASPPAKRAKTGPNSHSDAPRVVVSAGNSRAAVFIDLTVSDSETGTEANSPARDGNGPADSGGGGGGAVAEAETEHRTAGHAERRIKKEPQPEDELEPELEREPEQQPEKEQEMYAELGPPLGESASLSLHFRSLAAHFHRSTANFTPLPSPPTQPFGETGADGG